MEPVLPMQRISASLYVGDLPVDLPNPEDALFTLFNKIGMVISIKVCRDINTQRSLGYAYVNFQAPADAKRAIETLNYTDIVPNHPVRIMWSTRDPTMRKSGSNNLFIKNLDPAVTLRQLRDAFAVHGTILSCKIATDDQGKSRGYGFVHFERDECAKKAVVLDGTTLGAQPIQVVPFVKKAEREAEAAKSFVSLYLKNIKGDATEESIKAELTKLGEVKSVFISTHPQHKTKFALVVMESHEGAVAVIEKHHNNASSALSDSEQPLYVCRAQKKADRLKQDRQSQNLYQSQGRNIYIKHLDDEVTKERLEELFAPFGTITSSALMNDTTGNFRGFGFVCFESKDAAAAAIREMNGKIVFRRPLYVSQAQQRDMRHQVLDEQRKALLLQQQRVSMQMAMHPSWGRYGAGGAGGLPHMMGQFMMPPMGGGPSIRRPPMNMRMMPPPGAGPRMNFRPPMNMLHPPRSYTQQAPPPMMGQAPQQRTMGGQQGSGSGISAQQLAKMSQEEQKNALGERLYSKIHEVNPTQAAKITGMLLEMETGEILNVLEDHRTLLAKVSEAVTVLQQHEATSH